jgi:cyclopropane fatty-acyl-phospholipid synthase-like methyltransferase
VSSFQSAYLHGTPPWDIGRAQGAFVRLAESAGLRGPLLDAGCGTGENALFLAGMGLDVVGIDGAPAAIEAARRKASERGISARFEVADLVELTGWDGAFESAIDSGCFHVFDDADRARYVTTLHRVLRPDAQLHVLCFSDRVPGDVGPRRVSQAELRDAFSEGWVVESIADAVFEVGMGPGQVDAWLATVMRV